MLSEDIEVFHLELGVLVICKSQSSILGGSSFYFSGFLKFS